MIKKFKRSFTVESLNGHFNNHQSLIGALLDRWVLPGEPLRDREQPHDVPLRLAVRDGYLNLYAYGQSVAKISVPGGKPRLDVHWKYVEGIRKTPGKELTDGKTYRQFSGDALADNAAVQIVAGWIDTALTYAGDEKKFVEQLVARNANVIDLEMGLPGDPTLGPRKVKKEGGLEGESKAALFSPRMDLVVVQFEGRTPLINFWEAKLANNGELRATLPANGGTRRPHVCDQIDVYARWMGIIGRLAEVRAAYQETAIVCNDLADRAGKFGKARDVWSALAKAIPKINPRAGIVIANYYPDAPDTRFPQVKSFEMEGHRKRLCELEYKLREVESLTCEKGMICEILVGGAL